MTAKVQKLVPNPQFWGDHLKLIFPVPKQTHEPVTIDLVNQSRNQECKITEGTLRTVIDQEKSPTDFIFS